MKNVLITIASVLGAIIAIGIVLFVATGVDVGNYAFWAPKRQAVERRTFENTPSYIQGKNQDLAKYHHEWLTDSSAENRQAIEALVRQQFGSFSRSKVEDPELASWLGQCLNK